MNQKPTHIQNQVQMMMIDQRRRKIKSQERKSKKNAKEESDEKVEFEDEVFPDLTYEEVQVNLRVLADLKEGERLMISKQFIEVDQRYLQSLRRYLTDDSRVRTINFVSHVIEHAKKYCSEAVAKINEDDSKKINMEKLVNLQTLLKASKTGLSRLAMTYSSDKLNHAKIETSLSTIDVFCDQDLKQALKNTNQN